MSRPTSSKIAANYIRQLIFEGELRPGQRVTQDEIANALGLSHLPVREAIVALEREGFVTTEHNRGAFVRSVTEQAVRDQYEMYGMFYGFAAECALERSGTTFIERLRAIERSLATADDPALIGDLALEFNRTVVTAARSPRIMLVIKALPALRANTFFVLLPDAIPAEKRGLRRVLLSFERQDAAQAATRYVTVMRKLGDHVVKLFRERGLFSSETEPVTS
jgi:DNA-binding GntR family transcriptional regulator